MSKALTKEDVERIVEEQLKPMRAHLKDAVGLLLDRLANPTVTPPPTVQMTVTSDWARWMADTKWDRPLNVPISGGGDLVFNGFNISRAAREALGRDDG